MRHALAWRLALALVVATCALADPTQAAGEKPTKTVSVKIDNFSFVPADLKIARGTKVSWTNADDVPHVVLTVDRTVKSPPLDTDDTFSYVFDKAGTYRYFCSLHPRMTGTIVVE